MYFAIRYIVFLLLSSKVTGYWNPAIDTDMHNDALDSELCQEQLMEISLDTTLALSFLDSGLRLPRGILDGNFEDLGNYHQCLKINQQLTNTTVQGKYCSTTIEISSDTYNILSFEQNRSNIEIKKIVEEILYKRHHVKAHANTINSLNRVHKNKFYSKTLDSLLINSTLPTFTIAVCVPKTCTTEQALEVLLPALNSSGVLFEEVQCRLLDDKPLVLADYVAIAIFSLIGFLTVLSTSYDVYSTIYHASSGFKVTNKLYTSFSVYSNTRRLVTYNSSPKTIECLDGIRVIAMAWVIIGHRFSHQMSRPLLNLLDVYEKLTTAEPIWIISAPMTVDTFFLLSGLLVVYTTVGKLSSIKFLKNIHVFYFLRYLRMFPVLATAVLLEASLFNHIVDGPRWSSMSFMVESCRANWWATLLYLQNYLSGSFADNTSMCVSHAWYLAVDFQLHILSPIVLYWVLSGGRKAWISLIAALVISISATAAYVSVKGFESAYLFASEEYSKYFYINTLTRSSPFLIGMLIGYILHAINYKRIQNTRKLTRSVLWILSVSVTTLIVYTCYEIHTPGWNNKVLDIIINSFMRPVWALAVGWMILACHYGFAGPINWFLSLRMWKIPSRLTYAMFVFHYPLQFVIDATDVSPVYFSVIDTFFRFFGDLALTTIVSLIVVIVIDAPFSTLIKLSVGGKQNTK